MTDFQAWSQGREAHWNTETRLPPVGVWLWIRLPDCAPVRVKRKSWMTSANGTPEYVTEDGQAIWVSLTGRFVEVVMCTERQHDAENIRLRHEVAELKASRAEYMDMLQSYSGLVYEIRKAAGDPEGRLMQDELVAYIAELKQAADAIHARNTAKDWPKWRATYQSDAQAAMSAFNALVEARKEIDYLRSIVDQGIA